MTSQGPPESDGWTRLIDGVCTLGGVDGFSVLAVKLPIDVIRDGAEDDPVYRAVYRKSDAPTAG